MAAMPCPNWAAPRPEELHFARRIAAVLWVASAAMMALLVAWSVGPHWPM